MLPPSICCAVSRGACPKKAGFRRFSGSLNPRYIHPKRRERNILGIGLKLRQGGIMLFRRIKKLDGNHVGFARAALRKFRQPCIFLLEIAACALSR
jgi:hypothetical protein